MHKLLAMIAGVLLIASFAAPAAAVGVTTTYKTIPGWDGTPLGAFVIVPKGQGPYPLLVMPSSWATPDVEYVVVGNQLASQGYVVVSYGSRGFWESGGKIDISGPATVEDLSAVIDWALVNTPSDPKKIGASGISYGAGTSLLAATRDPRIKAVAALSGWADIEASLYANQTVSSLGITALVALGYATGRPGDELKQATSRIAVGNFDGAVQDLLPVTGVRSAGNGVQALNQNGTAVYLANAYNDSFFAPGQYIDFFNKLTGPKQLRFEHGDHATADIPGVLALPTGSYTGVGRWFDRYLKGIDNGIDREPAVQLKTQNGNWHNYTSWAAVQASARTYALTKPSGLLAPTGSLSNASSTGWRYSIATGVPTFAEAGVPFVSTNLQAFGLPPKISIPLVLRSAAGVWEGPTYWSKQRLTGTPELHVTVTPDRANTTLFAYLYSVDLFGSGTLLSHKPYSLRDVAPGAARTLDIRLEATSWEIPAGSKLVLVVDTTDPIYAGLSRLGGSVSFSSPAASPSTLRIPLQ